jgi:hypothetical protein
MLKPLVPQEGSCDMIFLAVMGHRRRLYLQAESDAAGF